MKKSPSKSSLKKITKDDKDKSLFDGQSDGITEDKE
jgi:hypothetical protein